MSEVTSKEGAEVENEEDEAEDDDEDNEDEKEDELDQLWETRGSSADFPSEYYQIQKLIKYAKCGNPTATLLSLYSLRHYDYGIDINQKAIFDDNGMELFLNILETNELFCQIASLKLICILSKFLKCRRLIVSLDGVQTLVRILSSNFSAIQCISAEILSDLIVSRRAAHILIQSNGVQALMKILDIKTLLHEQSNISKRISGTPMVNLAVKWAAIALASIAKIRNSKQILYDHNVIQLVVAILKTPMNSTILTPVVKIIQHCVTEAYFYSHILENNVMALLIQILKIETYAPLLTNCVNTITKCAGLLEIQILIRNSDGLKPLVNILISCKPVPAYLVEESKPLSAIESDKQLLAAVTGAIWKCSTDNSSNVQVFQSQKIVEHLTEVLLENNDVEVCRNSVGGLSECVSDTQQMNVLSRKGVITMLIGLLSSTDQQLLINICKLISRSCVCSAVMKKIEKQDGIRHLWSLLKNNNPEVQCCAGQAIYGCISQLPHITELVRNFVGGLELLVDLLNSSNINVLTSTCGVLSIVAKNTDNLAIIIDNGAVTKLSNLTTNEISNTNSQLQQYLADAIANCCSIGGKLNVVSFGENRAVSPLVNWMKSDNPGVRHTAAKALAVLSTDEANCIEMHHHEAVKLLLNMINCEIESVQEDAAATLANIRKAVLAEKSLSIEKNKQINN